MLSQDAYPLFGIIDRINNLSGTRSKIVFNPQKIISKQDDVILKTNDKIKIFSNKEIKKLVKDATYNELDEENGDLGKDINNIKKSTFYESAKSDNISNSNLNIEDK